MQCSEKSVLLLQMGKTAGNTTRRSLQFKGFEVSYVHFLNGETIKSNKEHQERIGIIPPNHWLESNRIRGLIDEYGPKSVFGKVITTFREPVGRHISCVFEEFDRLFGQYTGRDDDEAVGYIIGHLQQHFREKFCLEQDFATNWFDNEMKESLGIDVYQRPFDHARGYIIIDQTPVKLLVMKYERIKEIFSQALSTFLGTDIASPVNSNVSSQKHYARLYKRVLREIKFDRQLLEYIYDSKYMRHFYSGEEIRGLVDRWSGRAGSMEKLISLAERKMAEGFYDEAEQACGKILASKPECIEASRILAKCYLKTGREQMAIREFTGILRKAPYDRETVIETSKLLAGNGMTESALKLCLCYFQKNPEDFEVGSLFNEIQASL